MLKAKRYPAADVVIAATLWVAGPARPQSYPAPDPRGGQHGGSGYGIPLSPAPAAPAPAPAPQE